MTNLTHNFFILQDVYYSPLHVSSNVVLIIRRSNFINTAPGIVSLSKWPTDMQVARELFFTGAYKLRLLYRSSVLLLSVRPNSVVQFYLGVLVEIYSI